jgi:hypothetical protein
VSAALVHDLIRNSYLEVAKALSFTAETRAVCPPAAKYNAGARNQSMQAACMPSRLRKCMANRRRK